MTDTSEFTGSHGSGETLLRRVAQARDTFSFHGSQGHRAPCLAKFRIRLPRGWLISIAGFLYALSMHKFATRDPLSENTGIQGVIETLSIASAFTCIVVATWKVRRRHARSITAVCFAIFSLFALASFWRSFNPSLSFVKGSLLSMVLGTGYLSSQAGMGKKYFRSIYWSYTALLVTGLLVGLLFPQHYPLFSVNAYTGRTRLSVFDTFPGTMGEDAALLLLIEPLIHARSRLIPQIFLFSMNIFAGGKTSTALLCVLLLIRFVAGIRQWRSRRALAVVLAMVCIVSFSVVQLLGLRSQDHVMANAAESIYGTGVGEDAANLDGRLALWSASLKLLPNAMFLGFGLDGTRTIMLEVASWAGTSHNGYLELALSGGLVGFTFLCFGFLLVAVACFNTPFPFYIHAELIVAFILINSIIGGIFSSPSYFGLLIFSWLLYQAEDSRKADLTRPKNTMANIQG